MKRKTKFLFAIAGLLSISILTLIILISIPVKVVFHTNESELNKKNSIHQIEVTPNFNKNNTEIISISDLFSIKFGKIFRIVRKSDSICLDFIT